MKVLSVCGITQSGKTTTIENIIRELSARGYMVGSVKEIHFEKFAIDPEPTSNTRRHREAGAKLVTARGYFETDILYPEKLPMRKILSFYEGYDFVVLEGVSDIPVPTIVTAHAADDLEQKLSSYTFCISGRIANQINKYKMLPAISSVTDIRELVDLIEQKVYDLLPDFNQECCSACGFSCAELGKEILGGNAKRSDCVADKGIELTVDGTRINLVPFVQSVLRDTVLGVVKNLDGYREGAEIKIKL